MSASWSVSRLKELRFYDFYCKLLRKLLVDTEYVLNEINNATCFKNSLSGSTLMSHSLRSSDVDHNLSQTYDYSFCEQMLRSNTKMCEEDKEQIKLIYCHPFTITILSHKPSFRLKMLKELLGQQVVEEDGVDDKVLWAPLLLRSGYKARLVRHTSSFVSSHTTSESVKRKNSTPFNHSVKLSDIHADALSHNCSYVEVFLNNLRISHLVTVYIPEIREENSWESMFKSFQLNSNRLFIFLLESSCLSSRDLKLIKYLKNTYQSISIFFVIYSPAHSHATGHQHNTSPNNKHEEDNHCAEIESQLHNLDFKLASGLYDAALHCTIEADDFSNSGRHRSDIVSSSSSSSSSSFSSSYRVSYDSSCAYEVVHRPDAVNLASSLNHFIKWTCRRNVLEATSLLTHLHLNCLESIVTMVFSMARNSTHVPPRIKFARLKEEELFRSLSEMALNNQSSMKNTILTAVQSHKQSLIQEAASCDIIGMGEARMINSTKELKMCTEQVEEFVLKRLNQCISTQLVQSISVLRDNYTGILSRCLACLEQPDCGDSSTSKALKEIVDAAYKVDMNMQAADSILNNFIEKLKKMFSWGRSGVEVNENWKSKVATDLLDSLSEHKCNKLARSICRQMNDRLRRSHMQFEASLQQLEAKTGMRLEKMEEQRLKIRREYAPKVAKLSLESRSLLDLVKNGKPQLGKMLGNGQYGVVFRCEKWGGIKGPLAVKTLVPPDEKHWNDLAMEYYYTRCLPDHDRVTRVRGSVIDYNHSSGPAVFLVMDLLKQDLHMAIERGLSWPQRLQATIDVVEGIRFLHRQGLVHRDIKLKNVLLDEQNRAKLTDLGFCKPETLMTGSVVGSPIHMAPELITGKYDHSVDVYAFGVLFWYVCSGSVVLPLTFQKCSNKDKLWSAVKKGVRPEKPAGVDAECWQLILKCWHADSTQRPLVGEIESSLRSIYKRFVSDAVEEDGEKRREKEGKNGVVCDGEFEKTILKNNITSTITNRKADDDEEEDEEEDDVSNDEGSCTYPTDDDDDDECDDDDIPNICNAPVNSPNDVI